MNIMVWYIIDQQQCVDGKEISKNKSLLTFDSVKTLNSYHTFCSQFGETNYYYGVWWTKQIMYEYLYYMASVIDIGSTGN